MVHSRSALRVGGHQSLQVVEFLSDTKVPGPPLVTYGCSPSTARMSTWSTALLLNVHAPKPTLSSLMLKLIPRVRALK